MPASPDTAHDLGLQDLQRQFVQEILYRKSDGLRSQVVANGLDADRRLAIYRTKARETFALALEAAFPVLLACMGSEQFRSLAWTFQRAWPSPATSSAWPSPSTSPSSALPQPKGSRQLSVPPGSAKLAMTEGHGPGWCRNGTITAAWPEGESAASGACRTPKLGCW